MATRPTVFEIHPNRINQWNARDNNGPTVINDFEVLVGRGQSPHTELESLQNLSNAQRLELRLNLNGQIETLNLPEDVKARLADYFSGKSGLNQFDSDCLSFAHHLMGEPYKFKSGVDVNKFELPKVESLSELEPGEVVQMATGEEFSNRNGKHAAVYLGSGLFISKLGTAKVSIQDLNQIKHTYGEGNLFKQKKRGK